MNDLSLGSAILSVTAPGACILKDKTESRTLARECNEYAASIRESDPKRFGFFATLPSLLDTEGALTEIRYALDTLSADGICVFTRYGEGYQYLGHEAFKPIWEECNRRSAVVFIHPTHPVDTHLISEYLPQPTLDYPHETTRTAVDMITKGVVRTYSKCKFILSHAGGTLPYLIARPAIGLVHSPVATRNGYKVATVDFYEDAKKFYYDTALSGSEIQLNALTTLVPHDHILFGSDYPYAAPAIIKEHTRLHDAYNFKQDARNKITRDNAVKLFPRLA